MTDHQYHLDSDESIRDLGREIVERERLRAAARELGAPGELTTADVGAGPSRSFEPVFDEVEERISGREYYYVSEGPARQRRERERDFWS